MGQQGIGRARGRGERGAWRLLRQFAAHRIPLTVLLDTTVSDAAPDLAAACRQCLIVGGRRRALPASRSHAPTRAEAIGLSLPAAISAAAFPSGPPEFQPGRQKK